MNKHLKALHIRFLPEQTTEENISSREFLKKAEFINIEQFLKSDETESGSSSSGGDSGSQNSGSSTDNQGGSQSGGSDSGGDGFNMGD